MTFYSFVQVIIKRGLSLFLGVHVAVYLFLFAFLYYEDIELKELLTSPKELEAIAELVEWVGADPHDDHDHDTSGGDEPACTCGMFMLLAAGWLVRTLLLGCAPCRLLQPLLLRQRLCCC